MASDFICTMRLEGEEFAKVVRTYRRIENSLHLDTDVLLRDDDSQVSI